ncbi:delta(1)-pyrroline-2-carboxylate reductase family protein [Paralcaligenes sp. KSB-10]|uniref:bifunctional Delta(1)-pyrroline-2-carboxylate/Delta(1)-piperideine-2- carboxylate reductase n=1 Tax=Paralcaligenes sp. KSB-10 TaxID=2901142 RepID=UPI001E509CCE|nr:bifunctional Delta(1)-pyrroline-2-carboxylate/Delta(1)-piperideine-2-carboxylate reductase [Paralcaligenes sp. KSB-10]UHL64160.1 delta(1)-pyrroline-2-carboxylate reductase family protein [Paralcaligenes sp. KSB-10]
MSVNATTLFDAGQTAGLLDFSHLVEALKTAAIDYGRGLIIAPERQVVPFPRGGLMLSMPATADDIGIHKLVNVTPSNRALNLPTINGLVSAYNGKTGQELFVLDGPAVTARRTAAISMLALKTFLDRAPARIALIGTGKQASGHAQAIAALFPGIALLVAGRSLDSAGAFVRAHENLDLRFTPGIVSSIPQDVDAVITATSSKTPVYGEPARAGRLVIGVGAFEADSAEIAAETVLGSQIYVDDPAGARHEAGDLILAQAAWNRVMPLSEALLNGVDFGRALLFKSVGCAAWDLAAARCAQAALGL